MEHFKEIEWQKPPPHQVIKRSKRERFWPLLLGILVMSLTTLLTPTPSFAPAPCPELPRKITVIEVNAWAERPFIPANEVEKLHGQAEKGTYYYLPCDDYTNKIDSVPLDASWSFVEWPGMGPPPLGTLPPALDPSPFDPSPFGLNPTFKAFDKGTYKLRLVARDDMSGVPIPCDAGEFGAACAEVSIVVTDQSDLKASGIEITQGIQTFFPFCPFCGNTVPLVANKITFVRFYAIADAKDVPGVRAVIEAKRGTKSLGTLESFNKTTPKGTISVKVFSNRANLDDAFWFRLPNAWTEEGDLTLTATVNPSGGGQVKERDDFFSNNTSSITVEFQKANALNIVPVRVHYTNFPAGITGTPTWDDFYKTADWFLKTWPITKIKYHHEHDSEDFTTTGLCDFNTSCAWYDLLVELWWANFWTFDCDQSFFNPFGGCRWHALVPWQATEGGPLGIANTLAMVVGSHGRESASRLTGTFIIEAGTMAQEIGHLFNRLHPCRPDEEPDVLETGCKTHGEQYFFGVAADSDFPYPHGMISTGSAFGLDYDKFLTPLQPIDPNDHVAGGQGPHDFMSYGDAPLWVSDYTYKALGNSFGVSGTATSDLVIPPFPTDHLAVSALLFRDRPPDVKPFFHIPLPESPEYDDPSHGGNYQLHLLDAFENILYTRFFTPLFWSDFFDLNPESMAVMEVVPYHPLTARVVLERPTGEVIFERTVTPNPPEVQVITPNGGEIFDAAANYRVTWRGLDGDGDPLTYYVLYSGDGGQRWRLVANGIREPFFILNTGNLPGGDQSLIKVIATDGVNTSEDTSDGFFSVRQKPPQVTITRPLRDSTIYTVKQGDTVRLEGQAFDHELGEVLEDGFLTWSSNIDGPLGAGSIIEVNNLSEGGHIISLRAQDPQVPGVFGSAYMHLIVQRKPYLGVNITKTDVLQLCAPDTTHVLEVAWQTANGTPPVEIISVSARSFAGVFQSQNLSLPPQAGTQLAINLPGGGPVIVTVKAKDQQGALAFASQTITLNRCLPKASLGVAAIAQGLTTPREPVEVPIQVRIPGQIEAKPTPFGILEESGTPVVLTAPAQVTLQGGRNLVFVEWRQGDIQVTRDTTLRLTLQGDRSVRAQYRVIQ